MARQKGLDTKIQVTRGFVTEFTPVGFPQEAAIDIDNCIIDTDGSVRRRPGLDLEQSYSLNNINGTQIQKAQLDSHAFRTALWESVANSGTLDIVAQQVGTILQFYAQQGAISSNFLGEINLADYAVDSAKLALNSVEMSSGLGSLFVVSPYMNPIKISYDGTAFSVEVIIIQQRDFEGMEDGLKLDTRPPVLTRQHYYNLLNQGWTDENILTFANLSSTTNICAETGNPGGLQGGSLVLPEFSGSIGSIFAQIAAWLIANAGNSNTFPSNSDIMTVGIVTNSDGDLEFDPEFIKEDYLGNTPAPKGHFILDAFFKDYDEVSGCSGMGSEVTPTRPQAVAFHQGRIFFSSPVVQNRGNGIFYSQILLNDSNAAKCYQEADPTAAEINDLIATDGGFLPVPGIGQVFHMQEMGNGVIVLASNGVWRITGADIGSSVTATSIRLDKLHSSGCLGATSVIQAEGQLFYFGVEGIMQVSVDAEGAKVTNISKQTIQSFYINIAAGNRARAKVVFIPEQRKIFWVYRDALAKDNPTAKNFNRFLILDLDVKGFYKYSLAEDADNNFPEIVGLSLVKPIAAGTVNTEFLTDNAGVKLTLNDGITFLTEEIESEGSQLSTVKVATMVYSVADSGYKITFSTFHDRSFVDWRGFSIDGSGMPMESFVEFAEFNMGLLHTKGTPTYVHSYFQKSSKNLATDGYYELPPKYYASLGLRCSQSVLEVLHKNESDLRMSQSVIEVLHKGGS